MEHLDLLQQLMKLIEDHGVAVVILSIVCAALMLGLAAGGRLLYLWTKKQEQKILQTVDPLNQHYFFAYMTSSLALHIPAMRGKNMLRTRLMQDFLTIKFTVFKDRTMEFVLSVDKSWTEAEFRTRLMTVVAEGISEYENKALEADIPKEFILLFAEHHRPAVDSFLAAVRDLTTNDRYPDVTMKTAVALDQLTTTFRRTFGDMESLMNTANGEIDKLTYKGISVPEALHIER